MLCGNTPHVSFKALTYDLREDIWLSYTGCEQKVNKEQTTIFTEFRDLEAVVRRSQLKQPCEGVVEKANISLPHPTPYTQQIPIDAQLK